MPELNLTPRVKQIVIATLAASIAGGIAGAWMGLPVIAWVGLTPSALIGMSPELPPIPAIWQVLTYPFFAFSPFDLIFGALAYGWFAGDLERAWGSKLFVERWLTLVLGVALAVVLAAIVVPELRDEPVIGPAPILEGLLVAWGVTYPHRTIRIWMIIPVTGQMMVWITVGILVLSLVFGGPGALPMLAPAITAVALGIAMARFDFSARRVWLLFRKRRVQRELDRTRNDRTLH